jgi:DNA-binding response OmpR family regulator
MTRDRPGVILLEPNAANLALMRETLESSGFRVVGLSAATDMAAALADGTTCMTALLDAPPCHPGFNDACGLLRTQAIPFLMVLPQASMPLASAGLSLGARAVLAKPLGRQQLVAILRALVATGP